MKFGLNIEPDRPFRLRGYATGMYTCTCSRCDRGFMGDKRSYHCLPCAAVEAETVISEMRAHNVNQDLPNIISDLRDLAKKYEEKSRI